MDSAQSDKDSIANTLPSVGTAPVEPRTLSPIPDLALAKPKELNHSINPKEDGYLHKLQPHTLSLGRGQGCRLGPP